MHRSLVSVLIAVAYFSLSSAHIHHEVQRNLTTDFVNYVMARNSAENYGTSFPIPDLVGHDCTCLLTIKLDSSKSVRVLASGHNGIPGKSEAADTNAYYTRKSTNTYEDTKSLYDIAYNAFLKYAEDSKMKCEYFASAEVLCDIKTGQTLIGTFFVIAFRGYTDPLVFDSPPVTIPWDSAAEELVTRRVKKIISAAK